MSTSERTVTLADLADLIGIQTDPRDRPEALYIGLEHVGSGRFIRVGGGIAADVQSSKFAFKQNDVLYGKLRPYLDKAVLAEQDGVCTTELLVLRAKERIDPRFLMGVVHCRDFIEHAVSGTTGSQHPRTSWHRISEFELPNFTSEEQSKIADLTWTTHNVLLACEEAIDAGTDLKRAAMRVLFTRGLRGEAQKETEVGLVSESWNVTQLNKMFGIKHGFAFDGEFFRKCGEFVLLTPGHFAEEGGFRDQHEKTKYFVGPLPEGYLLAPGDLLVAMTEQTAGLLGSAVIIPQNQKFLHNQRLGLIVNLKTDYLDRRYLYHLFNSNPLRVEISRTATGSKVRHTSPARICSLTVALPTLDEQLEIVEILDAIDQKIDLHKRKRALLDDLFKTLLHKLMTGEIRVAGLDLSALKPTAKAEAAE